MRLSFRPLLGERHRFAEHHAGVRGKILWAYQTWQAALTTRRQRRALMALDDRQLSDIGLSRSQAYCEAAKPFLDVPRDRL
jgi:uncharacterized protein YjiS (DUF1127 family)